MYDCFVDRTNDSKSGVGGGSHRDGLGLMLILRKLNNAAQTMVRNEEHAAT